MIILPIAFDRYQLGRQQARADNWDDRQQYNADLQGQIQNARAVATFDADVNSAYNSAYAGALTNQFNTDTYGLRYQQLFDNTLSGNYAQQQNEMNLQLAQAQFPGAYATSAAQSNLLTQNAPTIAQREFDAYNRDLDVRQAQAAYTIDNNNFARTQLAPVQPATTTNPVPGATPTITDPLATPPGTVPTQREPNTGLGVQTNTQTQQQGVPVPAVPGSRPVSPTQSAQIPVQGGTLTPMQAPSTAPSEFSTLPIAGTMDFRATANLGLPAAIGQLHPGQYQNLADNYIAYQDPNGSYWLLYADPSTNQVVSRVQVTNIPNRSDASVINNTLNAAVRNTYGVGN